MLSLDPLAVRVARLFAGTIIFRDVPADDTMLCFTDSGRISARELTRMLEPKLGVLMKLTFPASLTGSPNTVAWEGLNENAELVTGKLVLHSSVRDNEVVSWATVTVDPKDPRSQEYNERTVVGGVDPDFKLNHVRRLSLALLDRLKRNPNIPVTDLVWALTEIASEAKVPR